MKFTNLPLIGALLGLCIVAACRGGSSGNNNQPDGAVGTDIGSIHIQDVQSDAMPPGTAVELHNVVVTAIDTFGTKVGQDMWVEEPGGGERSGVHVFRPPTTQIANLAVGDLVDITGAVKSEFATNGDTTGRTVTEVQAPTGGMMTVTKVGTGTVPDPHIIDAVALESMTQAQRDAVYEAWEGVLIQVQNVRALGAPRSFGTGDDAFSVDINGKLVMDSNLAMLPSAVDGSTCFASVTGVEDYIASNWVIYPRTTGEMVLGGTGCPALPTATVVDIQTGVATSNVLVNNVFVTAKAAKILWVADALQGAPSNGVAVFFNNVTLDPGIVVGAKLSVQGTVSEFDVGTPKIGDTLTEIINPTFTNIVAPVDAPIPLDVTAAQVSDIANSESYEGVLVRGSHFKVTAIGLHNQITLTDNASGTVVMDDDIFANYGGTATAPALPAVGDCYETLTGVMSVQLTDNIRTINPRSAVDMLVGAGCN